MKITGKVQTNQHKVNVLVETQDSNNQHSHYSNKEVNVLGVLEDAHITHIFSEMLSNMSEEEYLEIAINYLKKQKEYAISNCIDTKNNITYESIVHYEEKDQQ